MSKKTALEVPLSVHLLSEGSGVSVETVLNSRVGDILPVNEVWQGCQIIFTFAGRRVMEGSLTVMQNHEVGVLGVGVAITKIHPTGSWISRTLREALDSD